uniref:Retrotransposon gag domain-containing protein n=1 Tax=Tanacetum cinerariifolium TaxID=118510 RepID=A0A6L2JX83_TANCI|nr:hypothetical protein [Tanacetum cinerariifolium]
MTDNRTMAEMLRAPTEGCAEAIVIPLILAEQFELKHNLIKMMTSEQFFGLEKDNPHDHVRAARRWLEKEPSRSITTWDDLVSNEISNFQQKFDESFHEAWERYKDLLRTCPHHGFIELHQLDTFYNALNPADQDSLNAAAGGNLLEKSSRCCLSADGNTFLKFRDNIQGYVLAATCNYNQGNPGYRPQGVANQMRPPEEDECVEETYTDPDHAEYTIKVPPPPPVQKPKPSIQRNFVLHTRDSLPPHIMYPFRMLKQKQQEKDDIQIQKFWNMFKQLHLNITLAEALVLMPKYQKMLKALLSNKEKLQELANTPLNENCSAVILKKLPEKLGDPGKFLIPCGFSEVKCKALADLGASINLMPLSVLKKLGLPDLIPTRMTLELANRAICTPDGITRDVFIPVGKFTFLADFVVVDYESDHRVPLILGRPFLRTAPALIDVHGEEMILHDGDESEDCLEDLVSNKQSGNPTFLLHKEIASLEVIHEIHDSKGCTFLSEELLDINSFNDIHPHFDDDPLSGSTTYSANLLLEEFADELALITYPPDYDDNRTCDIESDIREIEFLLYQGEDFDFKDSIDQSDLTNHDDLFVDHTPEMFTDEQPPDYSFPPRFNVYPDDFLEIESDADTFDDDLFESKGEKIKEAELLIDQLDLPCDIFLEYDSFNSQDFFWDDDFPSPYNEDKVFNPGILIHAKSVKIITHFAQEKKLVISYASWLFEDFDPPFYELLVFKEVPNSMRLLLFSSENEEKVFKPGIYISKKFHCCFLPKLSHLVKELLVDEMLMSLSNHWLMVVWKRLVIWTSRNAFPNDLNPPLTFMDLLRLIKQYSLSLEEKIIILLRRSGDVVSLVIEWTKGVKIGGRRWGTSTRNTIILIIISLNESRNDWFVDLKKEIEANVGEHSLNAIGFVIELIYDSALMNATIFD